MFEHFRHIVPLLALGVVVSTAVTDAVYVMFTAAVARRRRLSAATWSSVWYLISSFAVSSYKRDWTYVVFAALGSWIGAYASVSFLHERTPNPPSPLGPPVAP
jgi:uncharacterized membrane protein YfcA